MRKFLIAIGCIGLTLAAVWYAVYYQGVYIDFHPDAPVTVAAKTAGDALMVADGQGGYRPLTVKGVELSSVTPGHAFSDFAADEQTYLRWLTQISQMGANTVRVSTIMDDDFYNALYAFNMQADAPLYLLQGVSVSDYANNSSKSALSADFYGTLAQDTLDAVDVVHGQKNIALNRLKGSGRFRRDVSPWVLGYIVGQEWDPATLAYTDHQQDAEVGYQGEYISTVEGAGVFETMLAKLMDRMVAYETKKYKAQRPVSFINDPQNDPFAYEPFYGRQIGKYNQLDAEHIAVGAANQAGFFASYRVYEYCPGYWAYFTEEQTQALSGIGEKVDTGAYYQGYTQLLHDYHTMPVLIAGYGYSSSRGLEKQSQKQTGPLSEAEQGQKLVDTYRDVVNAGCAGAVISTWQDSWGRRSWNTAFALDVTETEKWRDLQTDAQGYGLLSFDPGEERSVCYTDGDSGEWQEDDRVLETSGYALFAKTDEQALYLMIRGDGVSRETPLYVPIDITDRSGSTVWEQGGLSFERAADFVLCLKGPAQSRLLVQARYDAMRENFLMQTEGEDPFVSPPAADSATFGPIRQALTAREQIREDTGEEDLRFVPTLDAYESGLLRHGDGNPEHEGYDSRADFFYGDGCVEVRIPWQLLNVSDPSEGQVHDDYYAHYGVEQIEIEEFYLGLCQAGDRAPAAMRPVTAPRWRVPLTHERLKQSYTAVQRAWR